MCGQEEHRETSIRNRTSHIKVKMIKGSRDSFSVTGETDRDPDHQEEVRDLETIALGADHQIPGSLEELTIHY
jgi:hypothetical protein